MHSLSRMFRVLRAKAHSTGGWLAYRFGWHGTARRQFERVLLLRGADFRAYVHLGRIAFDHGDYAGWRREFEHARRTDPIRFARLRHPIELFEPRLAGTQFEGSHELDTFQAADSRATWRALHPFGPDPFGPNGAPGSGSTGNDAARSGLDGSGLDEGRIPDGFGRGTELPLAPGYDPMGPGQKLDDLELDDLGSDDGETGDNKPGGLNLDGLDALAGDPLGQDAQRRDPSRPSGKPPGWHMPDASLSRDDFASPIERRRFQLRRPIDRQEIARCDLNELARRLSS